MMRIQQTGIVLAMSLLMLLIITLISLNMVEQLQTSQQIATNANHRQQALACAESTPPRHSPRALR